MVNSPAPALTILEHTADLHLRATGEDFASTLVNLGMGLFWVLFGSPGPEGGACQELVVEADDRESLVVNFLNELLYCAEVNAARPLRLKLTQHCPTGLVAGVVWQRVTRIPAYEIKATTYHQLQVTEQAIEVIFDL